MYTVYVCVCIFFHVCVCVSAHFSACPGPFDSALGTEAALKQVAVHRRQLEALKREENTILQGLGFFMIEQPPSKNIQTLEKVRHTITAQELKHTVFAIVLT